MVDRIEKFIRTLRDQEREHLLATLRRIRQRDFRGLDMRKLEGAVDYWRVRVGRFRIIFRRGLLVDVLLVTRRNDHTYDL